MMNSKSWFESDGNDSFPWVLDSQKNREMLIEGLNAWFTALITVLMDLYFEILTI